MTSPKGANAAASILVAATLRLEVNTLGVIGIADEGFSQCYTQDEADVGAGRDGHQSLFVVVLHVNVGKRKREREG